MNKGLMRPLIRGGAFLLIPVLLFLLFTAWYNITDSWTMTASLYVLTTRTAVLQPTSLSPTRDLTIPGTSRVPVNISEGRYMFYYCKWYCGGFADRLKGMELAYVIAELTDRRFGIVMVDNPCPLTRFLVPNAVQWDLVDDVDRDHTADVILYDRLDSQQLYKDLSKSRLKELFPSRVALLKANMEYWDELKGNPHYQQKLRWMAPLSRDKIFARLFRQLFKLSPEVQRAMDRRLLAARPTPNTRLICAHLRFANNSETLRDSERRHTTEHGDTVLRFLHTFDPEHPSFNTSRTKEAMSSPYLNSSDLRFFVTSDSPAYTDKAAREFGDRFVRTEGRVVHVDRPGEDRRAACDGFGKVLVDQELLASCDVLVVSLSGLSRHAAYLRGSERGLYCVRLDGRLEKCKPDSLLEFYGIRG